MFPPSFPVPAQSMFKVPLLHIGIALVVNVVTCSKEPAYGIFRAVYRHCVRHYPASTASRFSKTNGLFPAICPSVGHPSICPQSTQVSSPFSRTQLCTGQSLSQKGVFAPSTRQPVQLIMSGVIVTPLSFIQSAAVFSPVRCRLLSLRFWHRRLRSPVRSSRSVGLRFS